MIDRKDYDAYVRELQRLQREIDRSILFLGIFNPEQSKIAIYRQCTRLMEYADRLSANSKQLRLHLDSLDSASLPPAQAQEQVPD